MTTQTDTKLTSAHLNGASEYRPDIDGLRAFAVLAVIAFHYQIAYKWSKAGFIGVDVFFVISGFLITQVLVQTAGSPNFMRNFYQRRIRRIYPALAVVLTATVLAGLLLMLPSELEALGKHIFGGSFSVANFFYWNEAGYFDAQSVMKPLLHLWSLGIEEQFYLVWPLLIWVAVKRGLPLFACIGGLGALSLVYSIVVSTTDPTLAFYSPLSRGWELAAGGLIAVSPWKLGGRALRAASLVGVLLLLASLLLLSSALPWPGWRALGPVIGTGLLLVGGRSKSSVTRALGFRGFVWIGLISFPLYLWHWPLYSFYTIVASHPPLFAAKIGLLTCTFLLSLATFLFVERPLRYGTGGSTKARALVAVTAALGLVGVAFWAGGGLPGRPGLISTERSSSAAVAQQFASWTYMQDSACNSRYPNPKSADYGWWFCVASQDQPPTLLLLGSSYANQLYPGIVNNAAFDRQVVLSIGDCAVQRQPELPWENPCSGAKWAEQRDFVRSVIVRNPTIRYAIVAGLQWNPTQQQLSDLSSEIQFLQDHQVIPIVFYPHIEPPFGIHECLSRPIIPASSDCHLPAAARRALVAEFRPTLDLLHSQFPSVRLFDLNDVFCTDSGCDFLRGGVPLLRDAAPHLSVLASDLVGQALERWAKTSLPDLVR